jgi:hypothetical protein
LLFDIAVRKRREITIKRSATLVLDNEETSVQDWNKYSTELERRFKNFKGHNNCETSWNIFSKNILQTSKKFLKWKKRCGVTCSSKILSCKYRNSILTAINHISKLNRVPTDNEFQRFTKGLKLSADTTADNVLEKLTAMSNKKKITPLRAKNPGLKSMADPCDASAIRADIRQVLGKNHNHSNISIAKKVDGSIVLEPEGVQNELLQQAKYLFGEIDLTPSLTGVWAHHMIPQNINVNIYDNVLADITLEEINEILTTAAPKKAPSPSI